MAVNLSFIGGAGWQFFDNNGVPLSGGKLYTYAAGTTTPQTTFTSRNGLTANTNPIILDSAGRTPEQVWSTEGVLYKYVIETANNELIRSWDNIGGSIVASDLAQDLANTSNVADGDALIGFRQSNSAGILPGAVGRTIHQKLQEMVSVKDFGAVGDGVADDTVAINQAIESLGAAGGTVYFPTGVYMVRRYLDQNFGVVLKSNITLAGAGVNASIIKGMPNAGIMHLVGNTIANESNISLHDLTLDHNGFNLNASSGVHALRFFAVTNVWIQRIAVKNSDHHGIVTLTPAGQDTLSVNNTFFVSDVYCENIGVSQRNGGDGIRIFFGADKLTINNVICNGIEYHGIHVGKGVGTVSNVQMYNCGNVGLEIQSEGVLANNIHIEWDNVVSNLFSNRPAPGVMGRLFWASDTSEWYRDNGITWKDLLGNLTGVWAVIRGVGYDPIQRISLSNIKCILNVNQITPFTPDTGDGVRISGKTVQLSNIHVSGLFRFGLLTAENISDNLQVSNMTIEGVRSDGVRLDDVEYPQISNLAILSAGTQGGTAFGINLRNTKNTRVISSYINDAALTSGITESLSSSEGTKVVASHLTKVNLVQSNSFNSILYSSGYITDNAGNANILASTTSVVVTHGLSGTPAAANISVIARSNNIHGNIFITDITSTTFTINCTDAPSATLQLSWAVRPT
jgi:hypothetical protein